MSELSNRKNQMKTKIQLNHRIIKQLYLEDKLTLFQIGKKFDVSKGVIKRHLLESNIKLRTRKEVGIMLSKDKNYLQKLSKAQKLRYKNQKERKRTSDIMKIVRSRPELKKQQSLISIARWKNKELRTKTIRAITKTLNKPEIKLKRTKSMLGKNKGNNNGMFGKIFSANWVKYKGTHFRSSWEMRFSQFLNLSKIKWLYESKTFDLGNTTYTPDFYLPEFDCYIEIKGWWRPLAIKKFKLFKQKYPKTNIKVLAKLQLKEIGVI